MKKRITEAEWVIARTAFGANLLSLRAIGRECGISEPTLRRRVKREQWPRGPRPDWRDGTPTTSPAARPASSDGPVDPAALVEQGRDLAARLLSELSATSSEFGMIKELILVETAGDSDGRRRVRWLRAIDLGARAVVLKDLAVVIKILADCAPGKKAAARATAERVGRAPGKFSTPQTPLKLVADNRRPATPEPN